MRANHGWLECWRRLFTFLKYDSDNVISNMSLPFYLEKKGKQKRKKRKRRQKNKKKKEIDTVTYKT